MLGYIIVPSLRILWITDVHNSLGMIYALHLHNASKSIYTSCESKSTSKAPCETNTISTSYQKSCPAPVESVVVLLHLQGCTLQISQFDMNPQNGVAVVPTFHTRRLGEDNGWHHLERWKVALLRNPKKRGGYTLCTPAPPPKEGTNNILRLKGSSFYQQFLEFMLGSKGVDDEPDNLCTYLVHMTPGQKH